MGSMAIQCPWRGARAHYHAYAAWNRIASWSKYCVCIDNKAIIRIQPFTGRACCTIKIGIACAVDAVGVIVGIAIEYSAAVKGIGEYGIEALVSPREFNSFSGVGEGVIDYCCQTDS